MTAHDRHGVRRRRAALTAALTSAGLLAAAATAGAPSSPRERVSLDAGWRFHAGDPADATPDLLYDVRPVVTDNGDGKVADTPAEADLARRAVPERPLLKPYILPSGNAFIADPARRHVRPAGDPGAGVSFVRPGFDDSGWQRVSLPHDWAIAGPFLAQGPVGGMGRLPSWGIGWYRRALNLPRRDRGQPVFLDVDGAMAYAAVWLNGHLVGGWPYGYNGWRLDLTPFVRVGGNELVVRLDNPPDSSRWYPGGGLYRDVWLTTTDPVHVGQWGTAVTTPVVSADQAIVRLAATIDNDSIAPADVSVATDLYALDGEDRPVGAPVARIAPARVRVGAKGQAQTVGTTTIAHPRLWGPPPTQRPNRYVAVTAVSRGGRVVDRYETRFGVRSLRFDPDHGLFVNGLPVPIRGTDNHHDLGALGAAWNARAAQRQLEMLQAMGSNALRMSHNPPAPELLDLADRMGFLVIDEVFDAWRMGKTPLDFHLIFDDWHEPDLRAMLRRDRNHPSVMMWSIGNEVGEQRTGEAGAAIGRELVGIVHQEDPTRPATAAMNWSKPDTELPRVVDVIGLNYQGVGVRTIPGQFEAFHRAFPDKMIVSTESASALSSRGAYQFPVPGTLSGPVRPGVGGDEATHQVSGYELFAADFGSSPDRVFAEEDQHPYAGAEFVWTGWDYLGEPTPYYSSRSSYSGIIDLAGFPKDRFWLYQARWRPELPMAHLLPHWTWPGREGQVTPVHVFTSGDEAELFVNGVSQGRQKMAPFQYRFRWDYVTYQPGELKVVTWKGGKPWATDVVRTAGAPARIEATADRPAIAADGRDLSFVSVRITDANGVPVPRAADRVTFTVEGPGEIVATDNGDPTDMTPFPTPARAAFNGRVLAIVRAIPGHAGRIVVHARAAALADASVPVTGLPIRQSQRERRSN